MYYIKIFFLLIVICCFRSTSNAQILRSIDTTYFMYEDAEKLYKDRQYTAALSIYNQIVKAQPNNDVYLFAKGSCHLKMKEYKKAMFTLAKATKLRPDYAQGYFLLATCYQKLGKPKSMIKSLEEASNYEDDQNKRFKYKMQIVEALMRTEQFKHALSQIVIARSMKPQNQLLLYYEGKVANQLKQYETAKKRLEQAIHKLKTISSEKRAAHYYELGYAYFHLGKTQRAKEIWKDARYGKYKKQIARYNPQYFYHVASAYFAIYDYENAEKNLKNTINLDENYTQAYLMLAQIQEHRIKGNAGINYYQKAINHANNMHHKAKIIAKLAKNMMERQIYSQALGIIEDYTRYNPEERKMLFMKGLALYHLGELKQAKIILENLTKSHLVDRKTKVKYNFVLAEIYKKLNLPEKAKLAYRAARYGTFYRAADEEYGKIVSLLTKK